MLHRLVTNFVKGRLDHCSIKKRFEKIKIGTPPCFEIVWWAPEDSVSHGIVGKVGRIVKLSKYMNIKLHVTSALFKKIIGPLSTCLVWKITRTLLPFVDLTTTTQKKLYLCFQNDKKL